MNPSHNKDRKIYIPIIMNFNFNRRLIIKQGLMNTTQSLLCEG